VFLQVHIFNLTFIHFQKPVAEAMRELLEAFRLPGESQQISRIAETFASTFFAAEPG
jgi:Sec7-like guanine-nucleotide exchange factor